MYAYTQNKHIFTVVYPHNSELQAKEEKKHTKHTIPKTNSLSIIFQSFFFFLRETKK